jgi:hypothetical protein
MKVYCKTVYTALYFVSLQVEVKCILKSIVLRVGLQSVTNVPPKSVLLYCSCVRVVYRPSMGFCIANNNLSFFFIRSLGAH